MVNDSASRFVARRLGWGLTVIWAALTACFLIIWLLPETRMAGFAEVEMGFAAAQGTSSGFLSSYANWMVTFLTFDWGQSLYYPQSVVSLYVQRTPVTLVYVVPAVLSSILVGTGLSTYAATDRTGPLYTLTSFVGALGLSVPSFVGAWIFYSYMASELDWVRLYTTELGLWNLQNLFRLQVATAILALTFTAVQVRHVQAETLEHMEEEFIKTAKAKGAGRLRVARHVFRNAWPSIASLVQGEALGLLVLSTMIVEYVFRIPGIARTIYYGFGTGDPMLSFTAVFFLVTLGVVGTLARDFARIALDPTYGN